MCFEIVWYEGSESVSVSGYFFINDNKLVLIRAFENFFDQSNNINLNTFY